MEVDQEEDTPDVQMSEEELEADVNKEPIDTDNSVACDTGKGVRQDEGHLIQIKASNAEILRRITAFIEQKQTEVDQNNRQEFCNVHPAVEDDEDTCARCRAIFVPRGDGKSHIKVSRVVNMYGPQTQNLSANRNNSPQKGLNIKKDAESTDGVEERLANMEAHLNLRGILTIGKNGGDFPLGTGPSALGMGPFSGAITKVDVYKRLKSLEERILFLESLSPEYFSSGLPSLKRQKQSSRSTPIDQDNSKEMSLAEIDSRIASLRESLLKKSISTAF